MQKKEEKQVNGQKNFIKTIQIYNKNALMPCRKQLVNTGLMKTIVKNLVNQ